MSSPTYDEQVNLSQDDITAFDQIEQTLSQARSSSQSPQKPSMYASEKRQRAIEEAMGIKRQPKGKENKHRRRPSSVSPAKISAFSLQPRLDPDSENPFTDSDSSAFLNSSLSLTLIPGYRPAYT